ncbi:MAG: glycosyltransferase family 2 protein [Bdellovibrio sp.]
MKRTVACVIPVKNVEKIIKGALDSVAFCDEIILVDMFSTDRTKEIATKYKNVKIFERQSYIYDNFNFGMDQATSDYIIRLDSDERLSVELQDEIIKILNAPEEPADVYTAPYYSYFDGHFHRYGDKFSYRDTLFKKGTLRYPVKTEHDGFQKMRENIVVKQLKGAYEHFSCPSIKKYMEKINYYSEKDVERVAPNDIVVHSPLRILYIVTRYFIRQYFTRKAYKDGYHGFALAYLDSFYIGLNMLKLWEKKFDLKKVHDDLRDKMDKELEENALKKGYIS